MYTVLVDEIGHYRDECARYEHGRFDSYEAAVTACRRIVDVFLTCQYRPGMTADDLFRLYTLFGEDPFVSPERSESPFSAWAYARQRAAELCAT